MLTGVTPPSAGDATFHGLSIHDDMDEIRESLGICFQHDVLYPELSVQDHLEFYARIKGYTGETLADEVAAKIREVGLVDKKTTSSSALSGGMKRKLSVAISLLGDSSLVFLDELTSGMDPYSRRSTWEILMNNRQRRVMVLTTHFMDEADILGDRIAIMAEGELRCCGSALYLINQFDVGYNLTIVKEEHCDDAKVIDFVSRHIPSSRVLSNVGTEITFQLPLDSSSHFPTMFRHMDENLNKLQILSTEPRQAAWNDVSREHPYRWRQASRRTLSWPGTDREFASSDPVAIDFRDSNGGNDPKTLSNGQERQ